MHFLNIISSELFWKFAVYYFHADYTQRISGNSNLNFSMIITKLDEKTTICFEFSKPLVSHVFIKSTKNNDLESNQISN